MASCPKCQARLVFCRVSNPHIDSGGFESYFLECSECGAWLVGIIDPCDEALLLACSD